MVPLLLILGIPSPMNLTAISGPCVLPCATGCCTNVYIPTVDPSSCDGTSIGLSCGSCKSAQDSQNILEPFSLQGQGLVTYCASIPPNVGNCPGLRPPGETCDAKEDCAIPPGLTHPVCKFSKCQDGHPSNLKEGDSGAYCGQTSDCVVPPGLSHPVSAC